MSILGAIGTGLAAFGGFLWSLFLAWGSLFIAPFKQPELLWIIVPIWLSWFFAEFFQEKKSTSFGNAISNGVIPFWVGIDWTRFLVNGLIDGTMKLSFSLFLKFFLCLVVFAYGLTIIIQGIRGKEFIRYFGRIREVTYVLVMFSPIIYGAITLSWKTLLAIILFFPLFYFIIELIDHLVPNPAILKEEEGLGEASSPFPSETAGKDLFKEQDFLKGNSGNPPFRF